MKKILHLFFFVFTAAYAQNQDSPIIDSLKNALKNAKTDKEKILIQNNLSEIFINIDQDQGTIYAKSAIALAEKTNDKKGLAKAYQCLGKNTDSPLALNYYNKGLSIAEEINDKKQIGIFYRCIGVFYIYKNDYENGLNYCFKSLKVSEELKDNQEIAGNLLNIGFLYNDLKDVNQALSYFNKALEKNKTFDNPLMKAVILENIGVIYNAQNKNESAIQYLKQALGIYEQVENLNFMATAKSTLGSSYMQLKQFDTAEVYLKDALAISRQLGINRTLSNSLHVLSMIYAERYDDSKSLNYYKNNNVLNNALSMLKEAAQLDKEVDNKAAQLENYREMSEIYETQNDIKNAFDTYKKYSMLRDSIYTIENKETVKNLEDKRTIELKEKEIQLNTLQLENKEKQKWYFIGGMGLLIIVGGLLFYQSRSRKKTNEQLKVLNTNLDQANKVKTRFFNILNHDLRSPVSNLIHFMHLQKENPELLDAESKARLENKTMSSAENLLHSMEDILLWSKGQMENFKPVLKNIEVAVLFNDIKNHFVSEEKVKIVFENKENIVINTDENYLKTIMRNLTANAIKALNASENGTVTWKVWQENNQKFLSITDNGKGASDAQFKALYDETEVVGISTGLGLHLIRDLANAINCKVSVDSKINVGTTFTMNIS